MRKRAFILILPFTVFILETVSFVPVMQETCAIMAVPEESSCCMAEVSEPVTCGSSEQEEDGPMEGCADNPDCSTCPVCYTFILQPRFELTARQLRVERKYASLKQDYISSYSSSVWKPPNTLFIPA